MWCCEELTFLGLCSPSVTTSDHHRAEQSKKSAFGGLGVLSSLKQHPVGDLIDTRVRGNPQLLERKASSILGKTSEKATQQVEA